MLPMAVARSSFDGVAIRYVLQCIFTARCYACAVLAMGLCLCVCVCLSQVGVLLKRLNVESYKQHHTIAQELYSFLTRKISAKFNRVRHSLRGRRRLNAGGVGQNRRLSTNNWLYLENGKR